MKKLQVMRAKIHKTQKDKDKSFKRFKKKLMDNKEKAKGSCKEIKRNLPGCEVCIELFITI
jgi:hypothetical protein